MYKIKVLIKQQGVNEMKLKATKSKGNGEARTTDYGTTIMLREPVAYFQSFRMVWECLDFWSLCQSLFRNLFLGET